MDDENLTLGLLVGEAGQVLGGGGDWGAVGLAEDLLVAACECVEEERPDALVADPAGGNQEEEISRRKTRTMELGSAVLI